MKIGPQVSTLSHQCLFGSAFISSCALGNKMSVCMKVVPLSQRSGVLEWCEGTLPMGEYLIGVNGAHQRYRPDDWKALDCRKVMLVRIHHFNYFLINLQVCVTCTHDDFFKNIFFIFY